ncbi:hypothetical protein N752_18110 [Desulforamulus aquiferis]|nr:hypothetical protein N752_18110 [Desulforamulus aquiferis]
MGQTAPNPVLTTIKFFREEYEAHILHKYCPAKKCKALISYEVLTDKCKGCGRCSKECPSGAIAGEKKKPFTVEQEKCVRCGLCINVCKFGAVQVLSGNGKGAGKNV